MRAAEYKVSYTHMHSQYTMSGATTIRLSAGQKRKLELAARALRQRHRRRFTQGQVVEALASAGLRSPELLEAAGDALDLDLRKDPFFNGSVRFRMGKTDARSLDELLYGEPE